MQEHKPGTPWTPEEDELLKEAVRIHGENDNWKAVAQCVRGRTNKACRKRWLHSLSPNVKKTAWTKSEDQLLLSMYDKHGPKWSVIARHIAGRTDDACSKRYREALDPSLNRSEWTAQEDILLYQAIQRHGASRWKEIGADLNRSSLACRNRFRMLERRKNSMQAGPSSLIPSSVLVQHAPTTSSSSWMQDIPAIETQYWETQPQYSSHMMEQGSLSELDVHATYLQSAYTSPDPPPPPEILEPIHSESQETPPFRYSSSSLSLALSLPPVSPSMSYLRTPSVNQSAQLNTPTTPIESLPIPVFFMPDNEGVVRNNHSVPTGPPTEANSPTHDTTEDRPPIPFPRNVPSNQNQNADSSLLSPRSAVQAYPTPMSSPLPPVEELDTSAQTSAPSLSEQPTNDSAPAPGLDPRRHYRTPEQKRTTRPNRTRRKPPDSRPSRLSAVLPATSDPNVLAYACGHDECWPADQETSEHCYATSQELMDHCREQHPDDNKSSKPFRCGLPDCGKHWRSINGLQYHLQISKDHYQQALIETLPPPSVVDDEGANGKKVYACTILNCRKQYKQWSGLKYHLSHGHRDEKLPTQLKDVPPTLARKVATKYQGQSQSQSESELQSQP